MQKYRDRYVVITANNFLSKISFRNLLKTNEFCLINIDEHYLNVWLRIEVTAKFKWKKNGTQLFSVGDCYFNFFMKNKSCCRFFLPIGFRRLTKPFNSKMKLTGLKINHRYYPNRLWLNVLNISFDAFLNLIQ